MNHVVRAHGWCPECKRHLDNCVCDGAEPGSIFEVP